jgi:signal transduction histidine kinase
LIIGLPFHEDSDCPSTVGRAISRHIGASAGIASAPPTGSIPVPARIALAAREAKDGAMQRLRVAAWGVAIATAVFLALPVLDIGGLRGWVPLWLVPFVVAAFLAPTAVGLLIALRQPGNRIAWIMLTGAFVITLQFPLVLALGEGWALQIDRATWPLLYAWPIAVAFVFPNGRLLSRRWRWVVAAAVVSFGGAIALMLLDPSPFYGDDAEVPNPLAGNAVSTWADVHLEWVFWVLWVGMLASLVAGAVAIRLRLRRSSGIERLQVLWLAWAALLVPVVLVLCFASGLLGWAVGVTIIDWIVFPLLLVVEMAMAVSVGVAVARYRLYAIERLVNRTLVYVTLTALLVGTFAALTIGLGVLVGSGSEWVTAAATLVVAVAFLPLRGRIQDLVDRRFSRARYDGVRRVRTFEDEVRDGRRAPEEIGTVLAEALGDPQAELRFWLPATEAFADAAGELVEPSDDGRATTEIDRDGARTAVLVHDPALLARRDLLRGVLAAAALSIEMARLRVELRLQLAEVEASRARIVEAGYEERRRLERDLHDGAQQRLVSLGVQVRRLQRGLPRGAAVLSPALDRVVDEIGGAITDLRQIAAGVRPARLDDGLSAALSDLARTSPIPVEVDVPPERVQASVEAAAYFVACEALTNAVRYASASRVSMRAVRENGALLVSITDDGIGGAVVRRGSGLAGLQDRVAAHGGTLEVVSPRGHGTRVEVAIPCES